MPTIILADKIKHKGDFPMERTNNVPLNGTDKTKEDDILVNESMVSIDLSKHLNKYKYYDRPIKLVELAELGLITSKVGNTTNGIDNSINKFKGVIDKLSSDTNNSLKQNLDISSKSQQDMIDRATKIMEDRITVSLGEGSDFANSVNPNHVKSVQNQISNIGRELVTNLGDLFIEQNSIDNPNSPISKVRSDMTGKMDQILKTMVQLKDEQNQHYQKAAEHAGFEKGKKEEYEKGTDKGRDFETKLYEEHLAPIANKLDDRSKNVTGVPGDIPRSKAGDYIYALGEDSGAPSQNIAIEVKSGTFPLEKAIGEMKIAKENRNANVGIFIWSESSAPVEIDGLKMIGSDMYITVMDDLDAQGSSFVLETAIKMQKSLLVSGTKMDKSKDIDVDSIRLKINSAINSINRMDKIKKRATTINNCSEHILKDASQVKEEITSSLDDISIMINGGSVSIGSENNSDD